MAWVSFPKSRLEAARMSPQTAQEGEGQGNLDTVVRFWYVFQKHQG